MQTDRGTGSESERIKLRLTIAVEGVDYDAEGAAAGRRSAACTLERGLVRCFSRVEGRRVDPRRPGWEAAVLASVDASCSAVPVAPAAAGGSCVPQPPAAAPSKQAARLPPASPINCAGQQIRLKGKNLTENEHVKLVS